MTLSNCLIQIGERCIYAVGSSSVKTIYFPFKTSGLLWQVFQNRLHCIQICPQNMQKMAPVLYNVPIIFFSSYKFKASIHCKHSTQRQALSKQICSQIEVFERKKKEQAYIIYLYQLFRVSLRLNRFSQHFFSDFALTIFSTTEEWQVMPIFPSQW